MVKRMKKVGVFLCVLCLVLANVLIAYAEEQNGKEQYPLQPQDETILPPTQKSYTAYLFDIDLPTCTGNGEYRLSAHYFDPVNQYGYPPSMMFSMETTGICDFGASVSARDQFYLYYELSGGSQQSHGMTVVKKFPTMNTILFAVNTPEHPSTAWVCDDEDYGEFYNLRMEQK